MSRRENDTPHSGGSFGDLDETDPHDHGHYSAAEVADACHAPFGLGDRTLDEDDEDTPTEPAADHGPRPTPASDADPTPTEGRP